MKEKCIEILSFFFHVHSAIHTHLVFGCTVTFVDAHVLSMCKEASRWESLKRGITLHLSMILEKVDLLNFFFLSLSGKA